MHFRMLGPIHATSDDGREVLFGPAKQRCVLAMLLSDAGEVVLADQLVDGLWGAAPPPGARRTLYSYVTRLRALLHTEDVELERRAGGYVLRVERARVDLHRFLRLVDEAQAAPETRRAAALLHEALGLCRREPLAGLPGPWAAGTRVRLEQVRVAAALRYHDIQLGSGHAEQVVARIYEMALAHPLDERLAAQLMTALYRCGRQAEALRVYEEVKEHLGDRLGLAPGSELQGLLQQLAPAEPAGRRDEPQAAPRTGPRIVAHGVPPAAPLGGRPASSRRDRRPGRPRAQVRELARHLLAGAERGVGVAVLSGPGGVGKSALAVLAAHRLRQAFPDGQLYVDLHGLDPRPADPADVLGRFLRALGVDPAAVPPGVEQRAEMYRGLLAGRRVAVVLDGAAGEAQVEPLLPGTPGCAVVATSRLRLVGLPGARLWELGLLSPADALDLLRRVAGHQRVECEPEPSAALAGLCGGLPLALRIAATRLAARPHWPVGHLAARLADPRSRLDALSHGTADVRATLAAGYRLLDGTARRLFRLLGLVGPAPFPASVAAALLEVDVPAAHDVLAALVDVCLLDVTAPDGPDGAGFGMHELTWVYARERAEAEEPPAARAAALARARPLVGEAHPVR
ncbi:NB-ARC domain-containing protein [Actinomadura sp. ATCC 31491]|uniref:NB-ARC domain-containing protein n=1 Tax=Actinomadura luzonensis TaxID=2805427 RepID=A0ABT0FSQ7_9ACTN|nr:AfsR/SARP family transcriptional regulator [Actinomadura luzonensis]MCK2215382.1 NB-ARC domain-containing protein [Actinomadura luzonensis]